MKRLLFVILLATTSCAVPFSAPVRDSRLGYTAWDCGYERPTAWVRADLFALGDPLEAAQVLAHELDHAEYMESFGSCPAWARAYAEDPKGVLMDMEARAYCASAKVTTQAGRHATLEEAARHFAKRMLHPSYNFGLTEDEAAVLIMNHCKD